MQKLPARTELSTLILWLNWCLSLNEQEQVSNIGILCALIRGASNILSKCEISTSEDQILNMLPVVIRVFYNFKHRRFRNIQGGFLECDTLQNYNLSSFTHYEATFPLRDIFLKKGQRKL